MRRYYLFGKETNDLKTIQKIHERSEICMWHTPDDILEKDFIGYFTENKECYDNCRHLDCKSWKIYNKNKEKNKEEFEKFTEKINFAMDTINKFINLSSKIQNLESTIKSKNKTMKDGFVYASTTISGSKKKRRFKKDNRRFLLDKELESLKIEIEELKIENHNLSKELKIEETLEKVIDKMYYIDKNVSEKFSDKFGYGKTVFLYNCYKETMKKLKQKVTDIEYNSQKLKNKEQDIDYSSITIFDEAYDKVFEIVKESKDYEEMTKIIKQREITKKAKFYIDEKGVRRELGKNIKQQVINSM